MISQNIVVWVGAFMTIAFWSFLYKENPVYRFAEHLFLGVTIAQTFLVGLESIIKTGSAKVLGGDIPAIIAFIMGFMLFGQLHKKTTWIARIPIGFLIGVGTGIAVYGTVESDFKSQIQAMVAVVGKDSLGTTNNIYMTIITIIVMFYFIFTYVPKGRFGKSMNVLNKVGRLALMAGFGTMVGNIAMGRWQLIVGRMLFILYDWLGLKP